ncbi:MAG: SUMF1/EgtB/PvdO family nonheme iron enzyme [Symploca sp. SIO1C2]|nr:SUMF1/EgtB/PvdO family nonheme iron enzyme [Symploca sp. SIO1C2]
MDEDGFSNAIDLVRGLSISNYKASRSRKPLGKRRNLIAREGDISLDIELKQAKQQVDWFVRRFHPSYRLLLYYAALPLILTPELLNYLRTQFLLYQVPWVAEVDILLSDLCSPVGYEQYEMEQSVRSYLLQEMEQELGNQQMQKVASRLISYIRHLAHTNPYISPQELEAQQWGAMVYLDEHRTQAEEEIAVALKALVNRGKNGQAELARLQRLIKEFRPQLSKYDSLIKFARSLGIWLKGQIPSGVSQSYVVHGVELRLPVNSNQFPQLEGFPPLQTFECEVATIELGAGTEIKLEPFDFEVATIELKQTRSWLTGWLRRKTELIVKRRQQQAYCFTEDLGNGVKLEMVAIPEGSFIMGSPETEEGHKDKESPQHEVTVQSFFMGKYPVTQAQWQAVAALPPVNTKLKSNRSIFKKTSRPVERVSWYDVVEFCARLSQKTGRRYRLPSEAEWEYACRAGTTTPFHFGEKITPMLANCSDRDKLYFYGGSLGGYILEEQENERERTTPVGSFKVANDFGLYDMHGNVREWCADHWHDDYTGAPTDGSAWEGEDNNENRYRLLRGASLNPYFDYCRSAYRDYHNPSHRSKFISFRVVCEAAWTL